MGISLAPCTLGLEPIFVFNLSHSDYFVVILML
jgi:hypothetical protein